jgi:hypothetical protein
MEVLIAAIESNPFRKECLPPFTKEQDGKVSRELLWGHHVRGLNPAMFQTAWLVKEDPLMGIAGSFYRTVEVRDRGFDLHGEAGSIRGNRRLTKARIGDAFNSMRQTEDQRKVLAEVLYILRRIQTVCFDEDKKTAWTMPSDLRLWNSELTTLWVDARCERMIEDQDPPSGRSQPVGQDPPSGRSGGSGGSSGALSLGKWISDREAEGWTFEWPIADGKMEDMKAELSALGLTVRPNEKGKVLKEDMAIVLGRAHAVRALSK